MAVLTDAYLFMADLSRAILLTQEQLEQTKSADKYAQLPPNLKPPPHWKVKTDEQPEEN